MKKLRAGMLYIRTELITLVKGWRGGLGEEDSKSGWSFRVIGIVRIAGGTEEHEELI